MNSQKKSSPTHASPTVRIWLKWSGTVHIVRKSFISKLQGIFNSSAQPMAWVGAGLSASSPSRVYLQKLLEAVITFFGDASSISSTHLRSFKSKSPFLFFFQRFNSQSWCWRPHAAGPRWQVWTPDRNTSSKSWCSMGRRRNSLQKDVLPVRVEDERTLLCGWCLEGV